MEYVSFAKIQVCKLICQKWRIVEYVELKKFAIRQSNGALRQIRCLTKFRRSNAGNLLQPTSNCG